MLTRSTLISSLELLSIIDNYTYSILKYRRHIFQILDGKTSSRSYYVQKAARYSFALLTTANNDAIGIAIGRLCEKCDGKCVICDSYVRPSTLVRICDECNYGTNEGKCTICGGPGISDAYYCKECVQMEKDVINFIIAHLF